MPTNSTLTSTTTYKEALSLHWSSIFAGVFIAMLTNFTLMSLGAAIGASSIKSVLQGDLSSQGLGTGAGLWALFSVLISLFVGSYSSSRVSGIIATRVGAVQGAVITAVFFSIVTSGIGLGLGLVGMGAANVSGKALGTVGDKASNPMAVRLVEDSLGELDVDQPQVIVSGVLTRLMGGDTDSAVTFLSNRVHISREDAQNRLQDLRARVTAALTQAAQKSAEAAQVVGWTAFASLLLGAVSSLFGGAVGAQMNFRRPLGKFDARGLGQVQPVYT